MPQLYMVIVLLCRVVQAFFSKRSSNAITNVTGLMTFTVFQNAVAATLGLVLLIGSGTAGSVDLLTLLLAAFSGISLFFAVTCNIYAMKSGTVSLASMFGTAGMILPIAAGVFLFDKPITPMQLLGVGLFFVSAYLLIGASKMTYTNFSKRTIWLLIGSLVANGCTMLAQQLFTATVPNGNVSMFSFLSFAIIAVLSIGMLAVQIRRQPRGQKTPFSKNLLVCGIALAVAVFIINQLATICTALVSPVVLFTVINGGGTIISALVAAIVYKEPIDRKTAIGIALGIASLVIIKAFETV